MVAIWKPISLLENSGTFCIVEVDGMPQPIGEDELVSRNLARHFAVIFFCARIFGRPLHSME